MIYSVDDLLGFYAQNFDGALGAEELRRFARQAEARIDRMSFYRLKEVCEEYVDEVKLTICAVAELMWKEAKTGNISAENTDGYSVTYKEAGSVYLERKIRAVCLDYLGFTGIFERAIGVI